MKCKKIKREFSLRAFWVVAMLSLLPSLYLIAQEPLKFKSISKNDGLSQVSVFAITQDADGFLWFGTRDGLNRWDGKEFRVFKHDENPASLISNDVRVLYADPMQPGIWVGTIDGLSFLDYSVERFVNYRHDPEVKSTLSGNVIRSIYRDYDERLWIATSEGLNIYHDDEDNFSTISFTDDGKTLDESLDITSIAQSIDGQLIAGTDQGLFAMTDTATFHRLDYLRTLKDEHITSLTYDSNSYLWIGTSENGIFRFDIRKDELKHYVTDSRNPKSLTNNNIRTMCNDNSGNIWIGTFDGLNRYNSEIDAFDRFLSMADNKVGLSDGSVRSIFNDSKGNLWIGTYYGGVNHLDDSYNQFDNYTFVSGTKGLSAGVISSFEEDRNQNLWVGTEGGGLNYWNAAKNRFEQVAQNGSASYSISGNNIKSLMLEDNRLWIGLFTKGLNQLDLTTNTIKKWIHDPSDPNSLSSNNVYSLHRENGLLWIATYGGGLDIFDESSNRFNNYSHSPNDPNSISSDLTRVIYKTSDQQLWIGTEKGLNLARLENGEVKAFDVLLRDEKIYALQECEEGILYIGTISNGLYLYDLNTGNIKHYTSEQGLPGNTIYGILEDEQGKVWISTSNGLSRMDPRLGSFTNYNQSNGLSNIEYNFNAYYEMSTGEMLFGGLNGFTRFHPEDIKPNDFIPQVVFTNLRHNNTLVPIEEGSILSQSLNTTNELQFEYNKANFSIEFAALDYSSPDQNHFAYKLEGLDQEWNYVVGQSEATYTIQRDGTYTFRLRGGNSDSSWNPVERQLLIRVLPPPWRTWWAYLIYLASLGMSIFGLYRYLSLRNTLKLQEIAQQQQSELNEMKLRFFTNITHEFRTPLTLIMGPLKELIDTSDLPPESTRKLSMVERNAQRLLNLVNQILTFRKLATDHDPVVPRLQDIVHFVEEIFLPFHDSARSKNITLRFDKPDEEIVLLFDEEKMEKVFFNLLSNALKFTPEGGKISIRIEQLDEHVVIEVADTGIGIASADHEQIFKRFYEKSNSRSSSIKGTGIGLAISKQMVELHHGTIEVESQVGEGTKFIISLPLNSADLKNAVPAKISDDRASLSKPIVVQEKVGELTSWSADDEVETEVKKTLLVVEDNPEVRDYICHIFGNQFQLLTAENGQEGLKKARKHHPDLIVSDVMMPVMDGIEMCSELKKDFEISHIPVLLLTARTASMFKIEGLKIGADDYLTKPFNPEELRLRVQNLIKIRQQAKEKFARVLKLDAEEIELTTADEQFLERALEIVEAHMGDADFNVDQFASELMVSRALLFSKIKALTDQTPNNLVKVIRMKRAAQLLTEGKMYVSEVAFKVGFKDTKYFSKCFQKQFGIAPSSYTENTTEV